MKHLLAALLKNEHGEGTAIYFQVWLKDHILILQQIPLSNLILNTVMNGNRNNVYINSPGDSVRQTSAFMLRQFVQCDTPSV